MKSHIGATFLCALLTAAPAFGQTEKEKAPEPAATFKSRTELVVVPAVVTLKSGEHVKGLKQEDFTLTENGAEQKIAFFEEVETKTDRLRRIAPKENTFSNFLLGQPSPKRVTIIVLDLLNTRFTDLPFGRLTARNEDGVSGWAALGRVSPRACYAGVAEVSVYVANRVRGQGIGRALLREAVRQSEAHGIWTLQGSVFPENVASLRMCAANGFRQVGRRKHIAKLDGLWRDTVLIERRSERIGTV